MRVQPWVGLTLAPQLSGFTCFSLRPKFGTESILPCFQVNDGLWSGWGTRARHALVHFDLYALSDNEFSLCRSVVTLWCGAIATLPAYSKSITVANPGVRPRGPLFAVLRYLQGSFYLLAPRARKDCPNCTRRFRRRKLQCRVWRHP